MNDVYAVAVLKFQQRRHHAHAHVDQRVADNLAVLPLDERVRHVRLTVRIGRSTLVGARAFQAELDPERRLDAVDPQQKLRPNRSLSIWLATHGFIKPSKTSRLTRSTLPCR